jgi:hypothetical protein
MRMLTAADPMRSGLTGHANAAFRRDADSSVRPHRPARDRDRFPSYHSPRCAL